MNYKNSKNQMGKETSCKNLVTTDSAHGEVEGMGKKNDDSVRLSILGPKFGACHPM